MSIDDTTCCGLKEIDGLCDSPNDNIVRVSEWLREGIDGDFDDIYNYNQNCAFILFTDNKKSNKGENLTKEIKKFKLGRVVNTHYTINPNSGNKICCWIWQINKRNILNYERS